jgi:N-acetylmuramoyl-L-alanine amidase
MEFTHGNRGNRARARFCNRRSAVLVLRLHADGSTDRTRHGISTLYPKWHRGWTDDILPRSRRAARIVQAAVVKKTGAADLGIVRRGDLTGFNWSNVPSILIEDGFMTNPAEGRRLHRAHYQWKVARGLARGAAAFVPVP